MKKGILWSLVLLSLTVRCGSPFAAGVAILSPAKGANIGVQHAVTMSAPPLGATVSGIVPIICSDLVSSSWIEFYVDGGYLASSPPYKVSWDSTKVSNGGHTISCIGFHGSPRVLDGGGIATVTVSNGTGVPQESHVFLLLEENHSFADVTPSSMPYLTSLESKAAIATNYFANTHPSLPNYMWLTTGGDGGFTTDVCPTPTNVDNIVRDLTAAGLTWKAYEESIPSVGYLGCDSGPYLAHHDPFAYFSDVINNPGQAANIVPFSQLATDIGNGTLPSFGFIKPNADDDAHDGTLQQADSWLQTNIAPLLESAVFQSGGHGLLIIVFDEGTDNTNGGGQVFWLAIGPHVKPGYRAVTFYQHENTLKLIADALNFPAPGAAVNASDMAEVF